MTFLDLELPPGKPLQPELDEVGLEHAAETFFPNGIGVSDVSYAALSAAFYRGLDLESRGAIWRNGDVGSLHRAIALALPRAMKARRRPSRPGTVLVIGCGDGRLLTTIGATILMYGGCELILNDLHAFHLQTALEVIRASGLERRGLRVLLVPGDITTVAAGLKADLAIAWFFVDAEIVSVESVAALRAKRESYRAALVRTLSPGGTVIRDRPDASTGFYGAVREVTRRVLTRRGLMRGEEGNLDLAWIPGGEQPYHLRYVPSHEAHRQAMQTAGFVALDERIQTAQEPAPASLARRKMVEVWQVQPPREPAAAAPMLPGLCDAGAALIAA